MQNNLDFDNHGHHDDGDEFIQYRKCNHEHKMLNTPYHASITHNIFGLVSIVVSDAWL